MLKIKRLYTFMLQTFLPLFFMTFGICLFIVLMQFLWRYIDNMVGKGIDMLVLGEMIIYAAFSLVPMALPLAILLASLMTFGNLGERLELLAMKSAGISLIHIMRPLIVFICFLSVGTFFFQNNAMPVVQVKLWSLIYSIQQKSPALDIPQGVFFNGIDGYNLYVRQKDNETGLLKNLMIYDYSQGFNNAMVMVADSGRLKMSADKLFLVLTLYDGEAFQNMRNQSSSAQIKEAVPYRRETFLNKDILIEYNANFVRTDESFFSSQYIGKNLSSLQSSVDSMTVKLDSIKAFNAAAIYNSSYKRSFPNEIALAPIDTLVLNFDTIYQTKTPSQQAGLLGRVKSFLESAKQENIFKGVSIGDESTKLRRHIMEWHTKFTISFACLMFFFIGAPLGAIIRKGGMGTPVVLSVILFIFYYIINNIGSKMARDGVWEVWQGMWLSSAVLAALGIFLTYKAVNDSVILNADTYLNAIKNLIGKRASRKVEQKEVIIFNPDYHAVYSRLDQLSQDASEYLTKQKRWLNYISFWQSGGEDTVAEKIVNEMENVAEELSNSDRILILNKLMDYPIIGGYKLLSAHLNKKLCLIIGFFLPLGIPFYLFATYRRKLLRQDIQTVQKVSEELKGIIINLKDTEHV